MNCELAHARIVAAAYGELPDEQIHELDRHVTGCPDCASERKQLLALKVLADAYPVMEPDANLVARSRIRLEEALDALPPQHWYEKLGQRIINNFASLQAAPVAACLLLVAGAGAGLLGGYEFAQNRATRGADSAAATQSTMMRPQAPGPAASAEIANISSIVQEPNSEMVEVRYNQVVPQRMQGSLHDPAIRQLLMLASANSASAGVRDDSVGLLAAECRAGHRHPRCADGGAALRQELRGTPEGSARAGILCGGGYPGARCGAGGAFERLRSADSHRGHQHSGTGGSGHQRAGSPIHGFNI